MNYSYYKHTAVISILITVLMTWHRVNCCGPFVNYEQESLQNKLVVMHLNTFIPSFHKVTEKTHEKLYSKTSLARLQSRL